MSLKIPNVKANSVAVRSLERVDGDLIGIGPISVMISLCLSGGEGRRSNERSIYLPERICCLICDDAGDGSAGLDREGRGAVDKLKREVGCRLGEMNKGLTCALGGKSKLCGTIVLQGCCVVL